MKLFDMARICILTLFLCILSSHEISAQETYSTLSSGDILAVKSNNYYIIDNNGTLSGVQNNLSLNALWTIDNNKLQNLETKQYLRYDDGYSLTTTQINATSVQNYNYYYYYYWYIYTSTDKNGKSLYYRPVVKVEPNGKISISEEKKDNKKLSDLKTQAIKITTKNFEREKIIEGGNKVYGSETTKVTEGTKSFSIPYTGGSCDLSGVVAIVKTIPYSQTTTITTYYDEYYVSSDESSIKILKQSNVDIDENSSTITGEETETLQPTSFTITPNGTTIDGYSIKGTSVILPLNTTGPERTAKFNVTLRIDGKDYTRTVTVTQARNNSGQTYRTFSHKVGQANVALGSDGLQQVHTSEEIVYALPNEKKALKYKVAWSNDGCPKGFYRWFNYTTDATVASGLNFSNSNFQHTANAKGVYILKNTDQGSVTYTMDGNPIKVACDVSAYSDYQETTTTLVEPTLSYRLVYDIRPASEMASQLDQCTSAPLETYNILAPAGKSVRIGPQYRWTGGENNVCYYYTSGGNIVRLDKYQWYKGGSQYNSIGDIVDNRLIVVTAPSAGQTAVYELRTPTGLIIARFNITAQDVLKIGPTANGIKTNAELDKAYELKAYRNFDYTDESGTLYSKPLAWDETTYGFTYTTGSAGSAKVQQSGLPHFSEYGLMKNTSGLNSQYLHTNVKDRSGNGYFLYIDANDMSGKVADLKINGDLCPNTSIWVSAWVIDVATQNDVLNLNFIVTGIDALGNESQILTYTTGASEVRGQWQQVLFEVELDEREFIQYRLRIDNNGAKTHGNDIAIDDIRIYTSKPAVMGIQAMNACATDETANTAILRIDYNRPGVMSNSHMEEVIYYRWLKQDDASVLPLDYIGDNSNYGKVLVNTEWTTQQQITKAGKKYYASLKAFLDANQSIPAEGFVEFYTIEDVKYEDGTTKTHPVLYIVHNSEKFVVNKKYEAQTMPYEHDFSKAECTSKYVFDVRPRARILVDGVEQNTTLLQNLNTGTYTLSVRTFGNNVTSGALEYTDCPSDWIIITNDINAEQKAEYIAELLEFREAFPSGNNAANLSRYKLLKDLYDRGNLRLAENSLPVTISKRGESTVCVAVPLESASTDKFQICPTPLEVILRSEVFIVLANPTDKESFEQKPAAVQGSHCVIRIPESKVKEALPSMDIDFINTDLLNVMSTDIQDNLFQIVLCETNDAEYQDEAAAHNFHVYTLVPDNKTHVSQLEVNDLLHAELRSGVNFNMKPGKYYNFHSAVETINGKEVSPAFNFDVYVVPDTVVWTPKYNSSAWHNDDNWRMIDGSTAFVPLASTNVIIKGDASSMPMLSSSAGVLEEGANQYLKYDIGAEFNSCNNIYFGAFAQLVNQQMLTYNQAYVDLAFDKNSSNQWEMLSMPLEGVVRGDFYIPSAGDGTFYFAKEIAVVDNRFKNAIRMKAYNSAISNTIIDSLGAQQLIPHAYSSAEWSAQTNVYNMLLEPARGYAFSRECATAQNFVRLPKSETVYYTYYKYKDGREVPINGDNYAYKNIDRSNAHKLLFDSRNASGMNITLTNVKSGQFFLVGNPFMANLDVKKFLAANSQFNDIFCYQYVDGAIQGTNITAPGTQVLRPMHAMFVQTKSSVTETTVRFTPDMIATSGTSVPSRAKALAPLYPQSVLTLTANLGGAVASTVIVETNSATADFNEEEDAQLFMLDAELTPIGLYSVASQKALLYNAVADIINIPISIMVLDSARIGETFALTFSGIDNFDETLYLYDAYYDLMYPLFDELTLDLELPQAGEIRYYITRNQAPTGPATDTDNLSDAKLLVVSNAQCATVIANENILSIAIYDIAGRKLNEINNINAERYQFTMPLGVYMLQINTESNTLTEKIIIK